RLLLPDPTIRLFRPAPRRPTPRRSAPVPVSCAGHGDQPLRVAPADAAAVRRRPDAARGGPRRGDRRLSGVPVLLDLPDPASGRGGPGTAGDRARRRPARARPAARLPTAR